MNIDEHGTPPAESEVVTLVERLPIQVIEQKAHDEARTEHSQVDVQPHAAKSEVLRWFGVGQSRAASLASPLQTSGDTIRPGLSTESQSLWTIPKLSFQPKLWRLCSLRLREIVAHYCQGSATAVE